MSPPQILTIVTAEVAFILLVLCIALFIQNRSLKRLIEQLKEKAQALLQELNLLKAQAQAEPEVAPTQEHSYLKYIDTQLQHTYNHHQSLNSNQDISLDIEPGTPLPHRSAAFRHVVLLAEKEANTSIADGSPPNWQALREKYEQLFSFMEEFAQQQDSAEENSEDIQTKNESDKAKDADLEQNEDSLLRQELEVAHKRIQNLERFKQLFFDLEEKWNKASSEAQSHYDGMSTMINGMDNAGDLQQSLDKYSSSYTEVSRLIETGANGQSVVELASTNSVVSSEVKQLREVAADQHRIITDLQRQLRDAVTQQERESLIINLQAELEKQAKYVKESESCIQLLEGELDITSRDLQQLKNKLSSLPGLQASFGTLNAEHEELKEYFIKAQDEIETLEKALKQTAAAKNTGDTDTLKRQLLEMETKYNELEEKFLDLKLQQ